MTRLSNVILEQATSYGVDFLRGAYNVKLASLEQHFWLSHCINESFLLYTAQQKVPFLYMVPCARKSMNSMASQSVQPFLQSSWL